MSIRNRKNDIFFDICIRMGPLQEPLVKYRTFSLPLTLLVTGLLCLLMPQVSHAQDDLNIHGVVSDAMTSSKLSAVQVTVMKDGNKVDQFETRANGKYEFYLSCGSHYAFYFDKEGYVKRSIEIDSRNIPEEVIGAGIIMPTDMSMFAMTPAMENADLSVFNKPIGKASYDASQADLVWDFTYTQKVKSEINSFIRNLDKQKKPDSEEDLAKAAAQAKFEELVKAGDAAMTKNNYDEAVEKFRAALEINKDDQNVKGKLGSAETQRNIIRDAERKQKEYDDAIAAADAAFKADNFSEAISKYEAALIAKPTEKYPKERIEESKRVMKEREAELAQKAKYDGHMAEGDKALEAKEFEKAIAAYEKALGVIPEDKTATKSRDSAQSALKAQQENAAKEAEYAAHISKADGLFDGEKYAEAKQSYQAALSVKSGDAYATERLAASDKKLAEIADAAARQQEFEQLVAAGDAALTGQQYAEAISKFEAALAIFADKADVKAKLKQAQDLQAEANALKEQKVLYDKLIADADKAFGKESLQEASDLYTQAREAKSDETYPIDQLAKIKSMLEAEAAANAAEEAYAEAMKSARTAVEELKFDVALVAFDQALATKPGDATATKEKEAAVKLKAEYEAQLAADKAYQDAITAADALFAEDKLAEAKKAYESARQLKTSESYPQDQIARIDQKMADREAQQAEEARLAALQEQFDAAMAAGDKAMTGKDYPEAIARFGDALNILADDPTAITRKNEAEQALKDLQAKQAVDEQYQAALARADEKFAADAYEDARKAYEEALSLKANEKYPSQQIALIEEKLAQLAKAAAEKELQAKTEQVNALLLSGDQLVGKNDFDEGIAKYNEALGILPERQDIAKKIAEAEAAQLAWLESQATDDAYNGVIAKADDAFAKEDWEAARRNYTQAAGVKPNEAYPKDQLALVDKRENETADAALAAKNQEVDALVQAGEALLLEQNFDGAIGKYTEALQIMPERSDVQKKLSAAESAQMAWMESQATAEAYQGIIDKADQAFEEKDWSAARKNYSKASEIKPDEKYPKDQLALIDKREQEEAAAKDSALKAEIDALIKQGDGAAAAKDYEGAILSYENALDLDASRSDVQAKIDDAQNKMRALMDAEATQAEFDEAIAAGDKAFGKASWNDAIGHFERAIGIKSDAKYPKDKIEEINGILELAAKEASEKDAMARQREFDALIASGDESFGKKKYEEALEDYGKALALKADSEIARSKIESARKALADVNAAEADRNAYDDAITEGDEFFGSEVYEMSKMRYEDALALRPNEKYPAKRIVEIDKLLEKQLLQSAAASLAEKEANYSKAIKQGDAAMTSKKYEQAINAYEDALAIKQEKAYPKGQIERANLLMEEAQAEKDRLAAAAEEAERRKKAKEDFRTVSTKSEEQAENFMQDALDAQEREKYERIKKIKSDHSTRIYDWEGDSELKRNASYAELMGYHDATKQMQDEAMERYEKKALNSQRYKSTLLNNIQKEATMARVREKVAYKQIQKDAAAIRDVEYKRQSEDLEALRQIARENQLFEDEYSNYYRKKNEQMVKTNTAEINEQFAKHATQLDDKKNLADAKRSKNLEEAYAKLNSDTQAYTDFFRMALALEYPQGVTEESSTLGNKVIITRIVVKGSKGDEYKKVLDRAGNYYFKNGQSISEMTWNRETLDAFYRKD